MITQKYSRGRIKMKKLIAVSLMAIMLGGFINTNASASADTLTNNNEISAINKTLINSVLIHPEKEMHIIVGTKSDTEIVEKAVKKQGGRITSTWSFIHSFSADIPAPAVLKIASMPEVKYVYEAGTSKLTEDSDVSQTPSTLKNTYDISVNAENAWSKGFDGNGITVAVIDTGVNSGTDFSGRLTKQVAVDSNTDNGNDGYGHGTHVAGIIAGDGSGSNGAYVGIAPKANIISVKVSDDTGVSSELDMVNGLQWVFDHREEYHIKVVNISSQVATEQSYKNSALDAAVEQLWKAGVVVVVSAGNKGPSSDSNDTISYAPSNDPFAITVGSIDENGQTGLPDFTYPSFSSYGTTIDGYSKPDLMAPGTHIVSYMPSGVLKTSYPNGVVGDNYFMMSGTSMSAPVVSGTAALLLQAYPNLTPDQVKYVLKSTTKEYGQNNGTKPAGTPGVVQADEAINYVSSTLNSGSDVPSDNQGVSLSPIISANGDTVTYTNISWSNISWSNISWSNISWSNISWSSIMNY
jgi:serine protease AprX